MQRNEARGCLANSRTSQAACIARIEWSRRRRVGERVKGDGRVRPHEAKNASARCLCWMKWGPVTWFWKENWYVIPYRWTTSSGSCVENRPDGAKLEAGRTSRMPWQHARGVWCWFESSEKWPGSGSTPEATRFAQEVHVMSETKQLGTTLTSWPEQLEGCRVVATCQHGKGSLVDRSGAQLGHRKLRFLFTILVQISSRRQLWGSEVLRRGLCWRFGMHLGTAALAEII